MNQQPPPTTETSALIAVDLSATTIALLPAATEARDKLTAALAAAVPKGVVLQNAEQAEIVTEHIRAAKKYLKEVEESRKAVKGPVNELGKKIDAVAEELSVQLTAMVNRAQSVLSAYAAEIARIAREAEAARQEVLRKQAEEIAKARAAAQAAENADQRAAAQEQERQAIVSNPVPVVAPAPTKLVGVSSQTVYNIEVKDLAAFYAMFPELCRVEMKVREAQTAVKEGRVPLGDTAIYRAWTEQKATVRS